MPSEPSPRGHSASIERARATLTMALRILGIDPGLQITGFRVIDCEGAKLGQVASGNISTLKLDRGDLSGRIRILFDGARSRRAPRAPAGFARNPLRQGQATEPPGRRSGHDSSARPTAELDSAKVAQAACAFRWRSSWCACGGARSIATLTGFYHPEPSSVA